MTAPYILRLGSRIQELNKEALFALLNKKLSLVKDKIKTNKFEYLERLEEGLIDVKEHSRFKLVESNETV